VIRTQLLRSLDRRRQCVGQHESDQHSAVLIWLVPGRCSCSTNRLTELGQLARGWWRTSLSGRKPCGPAKASPDTQSAHRAAHALSETPVALCCVAAAPTEYAGPAQPCAPSSASSGTSFISAQRQRPAARLIHCPLQPGCLSLAEHFRVLLLLEQGAGSDRRTSCCVTCSITRQVRHHAHLHMQCCHGLLCQGARGAVCQALFGPL
jgi:hypothetical protein